MGTWSVSTSGLNYIMEYTNGFKRSIRKNQVTKSNTSLGEEYASSQSPNLVLAYINALIQKYSTGQSIIDFLPDGSNGWNIGIVAHPTTVQIPSGTTIDSVDYEIGFFQGGVNIVSFTGNLTSDATINTGANGAGLYIYKLTYQISDGSFFEVQSIYVVDATSTILHYIIYSGTTVNSVTGLTLDVTASLTQSGTLPITWQSFDGVTFTQVGMGINATVSVLPNAVGLAIIIVLDSNYSDWGNPDFTAGLAVSIS